MLERRRKNKHYDIVPGDEPADDEERDVELGEGVGGASLAQQESGTVPVDANGQAEAGANKTTVTEELDNWDENADEDWEEETSGSGDGQKTPASSADGGAADTKKRSA